MWHTVDKNAKVIGISIYNVLYNTSLLYGMVWCVCNDGSQLIPSPLPLPLLSLVRVRVCVFVSSVLSSNSSTMLNVYACYVDERALMRMVANVFILTVHTISRLSRWFIKIHCIFLAGPLLLLMLFVYSPHTHTRTHCVCERMREFRLCVELMTHTHTHAETYLPWCICLCACVRVQLY